ncbi:MAG: copper homeostasis protein CutC [bacterium]
MIILEVCVNSVESAFAAQEGGASRVELCENLHLGGTTPGADLLQNVQAAISIPLHVMIRPRGGDFFFCVSKFLTMQNDVEMAKQLGANGVVLGILHPDRKIELDRTSKLIEAARPLRVTFHRAFDLTPDPIQSLEEIISLGIDYVLTSGGAASVDQGLQALKLLQQQSKGRITVLPGGGITLTNVFSLVEQTGVQQIHVYSAVLAEKRPNRESPRFSDTELPVTDAKKVKELRELLSSF